MSYLQTWDKVSKIRRWPVIGPFLQRSIQCLCRALTGHEASKTEWGYGGGETCDVWCRWCNHPFTVPKTHVMFRVANAKQLMDMVDEDRTKAALRGEESPK